MASLSLTSTTKIIRVAVVGVGLVGAEFVEQLLALAQPHPFRIVSISSSKTHLFSADGLQLTPGGAWKQSLASSQSVPDILESDEKSRG